MSPTRHAYHSIWNRNGRRHTGGSALIALIAAILIFSVLAAALLPMVSSSGEQAVLSNLGDKAYLLAEAGYRYVKSNYDRALTDAARVDALDAVDSDHDGNFTLSDGQSRFNLGIFSYFLSLPAGTYPAGTGISANPPGRLPIDSSLHDDNVTINGQLVSIDGATYTISASDPTSADEADDNLTISLDRVLEISDRTSAYPAARTNQSSVVIGEGLAYEPGQGDLFPLRNGRINVQGYPNPLAYQYNNRANNTFEGVRDPADASVTNISLPTGALILLNQSIRVRSTGIVGGGELETRRQVDYFISGESEESEDVPVDITSDFTSLDDNITAAEIGGNRALTITDATNAASLLQLDSAKSTAPLRKAIRRGGGYLSYDAQVKLGFLSEGTALPLPDAPVGIIPGAVAPVAAGLSFRLNNGTEAIASDTAYNGYGISFLRAQDTSLPLALFSRIVPAGLNDQPLMVLWQQTSGGINWLAYKKMQPTIYPDGTWIQSNWRYDNTGRDASPCWHYVDNNNDAMLTSPLISLNDPEASAPMCDGAPIITLAFWSREIHQNQLRRTFIISDGGTTIEQFTANRGDPENGWYPYTFNLSGRAGQTVQIRFTVSDSSSFVNLEWHIDDLQILYEHCRWPVQNATLLVRLREAAVVPFDQGGPEPIRQGDWIYGETSGTRGRVLQPPLLTNTDWGANTAAGTLLLNNLSVNPSGFQANEDLLVVGRTGGTGARVASYSDATDRKVNTIKVFYASQGGSGAANGDTLDPDTLPYPRRQDADPFRWPPDEDENWTTAEDYFRLVQWDAINGDPALNLDALTYIDDDNRTVENALLRSYDPDLQSPPLGQPVPAELGLHAYGEGADNVYFDDFGLRLFFGTSSLFDTVLQQ
jgi:type II secretory pathway pseudopilin PulG